MKIVKTPITPYKHFKDLTHGDVFAYKDATFMKTNMNDTVDGNKCYYAVNLHNGLTYLFLDKYVVIPVEDVSQCFLSHLRRSRKALEKRQR